MKRYLVTGGSGFIGSALAKSLVDSGNFVRVFDNNSRGNLRRLDSFINKIDFVQGDIRNLSEVSNACKGIDSICHLAYVNGTKFFYENPDLVLDVGVKGMINIIDAAKENSVKEIVLASSSEVYQTPELIPTPEDASLIVPDPLNPRFSYGGGKLISELLAINNAKYFEKVLIFRPHNVYGPDMGWEHVIPQFIVRLAEDSDNFISDSIDFEIQGSGNETRAFIYIDDFIKGLNLVINKGENLNIYHVGTDKEISISDLVHQIGTLLNKNIIIRPGSLQHGSTLRRCPDITKLKKLGFNPSSNLSDGLSKTLEWYLNNLELKP